MSKPQPTRYRTLKWSACNASLCRHGSLTVWFDPLTPWHAAPSGKRGGQPIYSAAAIQTCLTIKVTFGLPLRQTTGFVASLLKLAALIGQSRTSRRYAVDKGRWRCSYPARARGDHCTSSWIARASRSAVKGAQGPWPHTGPRKPAARHARKHGGARRRVWRKIHLAMDEATLEVRAVKITGSGVGDAPVLPDLLAQIPEGEAIAFVTADGAYDTCGCRDAIVSRGADAVIPPRRDAKPWKKDSPRATGRNEALRAIKRLGRAIWRN